MITASYSQIVSMLTDIDKTSVQESIGLDVDTRDLDRARLEHYLARRQRILEESSKTSIPSAAPLWEPLQCSFCQSSFYQGRAKVVSHFIKLSEPHIICNSCIDSLLKGTAE